MLAHVIIDVAQPHSSAAPTSPTRSRSFWSNVLHNPSVSVFFSSFLRYRARPFDLDRPGGDADALAGVAAEACRRVEDRLLMALLRMAGPAGCGAAEPQARSDAARFACRLAPTHSRARTHIICHRAPSSARSSVLTRTREPPSIYPSIHLSIHPSCSP
jgi:hypothetical protein